MILASSSNTIPPKSLFERISLAEELEIAHPYSAGDKLLPYMTLEPWMLTNFGFRNSGESYLSIVASSSITSSEFIGSRDFNKATFLSLCGVTMMTRGS